MTRPGTTGTEPAGNEHAVVTRRRVSAVGCAVAAAVAAGLAWWLGGRGVATDSWPAFAPGADHTDITRYSGAWLTAAAGAALAAALLLIAALRQGVRARPGSAASHGASGTPQPPRAEAVR